MGRKMRGKVKSKKVKVRRRTKEREGADDEFDCLGLFLSGDESKL